MHIGIIPMSEDVYRLFQMQREYQKNMRIRNDIKIEQYDNAGNVVASIVNLFLQQN